MDESGAINGAADPADYCRQIEAHLCRKNDGHLIRIVGPSFELVCKWAERGIPFSVACRGIDRYFERYYAKGPRRRPVRVEFCEADVLDVFDAWRRATGVGMWETDAAPAAHPRRASLPEHLERIVARLTMLRAGADRALDGVLDSLVREIDGLRAEAKGARGAAREDVLQRLRDLDAGLLQELRAHAGADTLDAIAREAETELAPFRDRMPRDAYEQTRASGIDRLLRERTRFPVLALD